MLRRRQAKYIGMELEKVAVLIGYQWGLYSDVTSKKSQKRVESEPFSYPGEDQSEGAEEQKLWVRSLMYLRNNKEANVIVVERVTREVMGDQLECLVDLPGFYLFSEQNRNCWKFWTKEWEDLDFSESLWLLCWNSLKVEDKRVTETDWEAIWIIQATDYWSRMVAGMLWRNMQVQKYLKVEPITFYVHIPYCLIEPPPNIATFLTSYKWINFLI